MTIGETAAYNTTLGRAACRALVTALQVVGREKAAGGGGSGHQ